MKMTFRWFGSADDAIPLRYIAQIPGIHSVVTSILDIPAGEIWSVARIRSLMSELKEAGLRCEVIESVNVSEAIKLGLPERERHIENYIETIRNLAAFGVRCICYNFMPVFDWLRSRLYDTLPDGSKTMSFSSEFIRNATPAEIAARYAEDAGGIALPGWEPERMVNVESTIALYSDMTRERYLANAKYFLDAVMPVCEETGMLLAVHPDDPPSDVFGFPRLVNSREHIAEYLNLNSSPHNGLTLCTGSLGADPDNDLPAIIREFAPRIHFAHIRNLKYDSAPGTDDFRFHETSHFSGAGSLDMVSIVEAFIESGFDGYVRPDHGRFIWGEAEGIPVAHDSRVIARPGYGLYDRALGSQYLLGLWEAISGAKR